MEQKLLQCLRCPECRGCLTQPVSETLRCLGCHRQFPVREGVPDFIGAPSRTARSFGYMWGRQASLVEPPPSVEPYHLQQLYDALDAPSLRGFIIDGGYSYGVVHHTPDPARAVRELARVLKPQAPLLMYVYEDFSDRSIHWRAALRLVNSLRQVTTRCPPPVLMSICHLLSPFVWLMCTVPSRRFRWAARFPYRHNTTPWSLSGGLYDRFSAPIEHRYSESGARALVEQAGLAVRRVAQRRGWMVWAEKPR